MRRRCLPGDKCDDRLGDVFFRERGGVFFRRAADLADHDDRVRFVVRLEKAERVGVRRANDRVAADADRGRLSESRRA